MDRDLRAAHARGLLLQALAAEVTKRANDATAEAYASAIWRNAKLRARFRRRAPGIGYWGGGQPTWRKRPRPGWWLRITWGDDFACGRLPRCFVAGRLLMVGRADATPEQQKEIDYQINEHDGDLPCCVCPARAVTDCLTHWQLYHAGAARCFRCERHPAVRPGTMPGTVCGPLWEGRRSPGCVRAPAPPAPVVVALL